MGVNLNDENTPGSCSGGRKETDQWWRYALRVCKDNRIRIVLRRGLPDQRGLDRSAGSPGRA